MIVHLVIKNCDMMIKNKKQGGLVMGLDDVKSNFHAIKSSRVIAFKKKLTCLSHNSKHWTLFTFLTLQK